jgi:hypothetical protein
MAANATQADASFAGRVIGAASQGAAGALVAAALSVRWTDLGGEV